MRLSWTIKILMLYNNLSSCCMTEWVCVRKSTSVEEFYSQKKQRPVESLPPTENCLRLHVLRAMLQSRYINFKGWFKVYNTIKRELIIVFLFLSEYGAEQLKRILQTWTLTTGDENMKVKSSLHFGWHSRKQVKHVKNWLSAAVKRNVELVVNVKKLI